jgi:predicted transcriptional regulator
MPILTLNLSPDVQYRLTRLAQRWHLSPDAAVAYLIDQASQDLPVADWLAKTADV